MTRFLMATVLSVSAVFTSALSPAHAAGSPPHYLAINIQLPGWPYVTYGYGYHDCCGDQINAQGIIVGTAFRRPNSWACGSKHAWAFDSVAGTYMDLGRSMPHGATSGSFGIGVSGDNRAAVAAQNCHSPKHPKSIVMGTVKDANVSWSKPCACHGYYPVGINLDGVGIEGDKPAVLAWSNGEPIRHLLQTKRNSPYLRTSGHQHGFVGQDNGYPAVWLNRREYILPDTLCGDGGGGDYPYNILERHSPTGPEVEVVGDVCFDGSHSYVSWVGHPNSAGAGFTFTEKKTGNIPHTFDEVSGITADGSIYWGDASKYNGLDTGAVWYTALGTNTSAVYTANDLMSRLVTSGTCPWWSPTDKLTTVVGVDDKGDILLADGRYSCLLQPTTTSEGVSQ